MSLHGFCACSHKQNAPAPPRPAPRASSPHACRGRQELLRTRSTQRWEFFNSNCCTRHQPRRTASVGAGCTAVQAGSLERPSGGSGGLARSDQEWVEASSLPAGTDRVRRWKGLRLQSPEPAAPPTPDTRGTPYSARLQTCACSSRSQDSPRRMG